MYNFLEIKNSIVGMVAPNLKRLRVCCNNIWLVWRYLVPCQQTILEVFHRVIPPIASPWIGCSELDHHYHLNFNIKIEGGFD